MTTIKCTRCSEGRYTPLGEPMTEGAPPYPALAMHEDKYICSACGDRENNFARIAISMAKEDTDGEA